MQGWTLLTFEKVGENISYYIGGHHTRGDSHPNADTLQTINPITNLQMHNQNTWQEIREEDHPAPTAMDFRRALIALSGITYANIHNYLCVNV